jgi:hypothetical protein
VEIKIIFFLFMQLCRLSRLSLNLFLISLFCSNFAWTQQKANDFTQRLFSLEGKQSRANGRFLSSPRLSDAYTKRIRIEDWPSKYSRFGGKRFTTKDVQGLIKKRVPYPKVENKPVNIPGKVRGVEDKIGGLEYENRYTSSSTVEFRDAYYAKLNQRMDEWMEKVNNLSLRDINRFQFRKGRPSEPGFPVQRAGTSPNARDKSMPPSGGGSLPAIPSTYWVGPRKVPTTPTSKSLPSPSPVQEIPLAPAAPRVGPKSRSSLPHPKLGPKKIRVQVRAIE